MTKHQIVADLFSSKEFNDCISKMDPDHLRDDLRSEVTLALLEIPDDKFPDIRNIRHYAVRIIMNMVTNKNGPFFKKFRGIVLEFDSDRNRKSDQYRDEIGDQDIYTRKEIRDSADFELLIQSGGMETEILDREAREQLEDIAIEELELLPWYDKEILKLYMKVGTYQAMEDATKIPRATCYKEVKKAMAKLRRVAESKMAQPLYTRKELLFIQNNQP